MTDNALYPVLISDYVFSFFREEVDEVGIDKTQYDRMAVLVGITAVLTYLNYRGA